MSKKKTKKMSSIITLVLLLFLSILIGYIYLDSNNGILQVANTTQTQCKPDHPITLKHIGEYVEQSFGKQKFDTLSVYGKLMKNAEIDSYRALIKKGNKLLYSSVFPKSLRKTSSSDPVCTLKLPANCADLEDLTLRIECIKNNQGSLLLFYNCLNNMDVYRYGKMNNNGVDGTDLAFILTKSLD